MQRPGIKYINTKPRNNPFGFAQGKIAVLNIKKKTIKKQLFDLAFCDFYIKLYSGWKGKVSLTVEAVSPI